LFIGRLAIRQQLRKIVEPIISRNEVCATRFDRLRVVAIFTAAAWHR